MSAKGKRMIDEKNKKECTKNSENNIDTKNPEDYKYGAYERNLERAQYQEKKKKKMNPVLKVFLIILLILVILIVGALCAGYMFINGKLNGLEEENIDITAVGISEENAERLEGYRNIALLGIDSREDDYSLGNRSDCIIIASLNEKTNKIKLISVYRDTYVYVEENGNKKLDKITHAYSYGGAQNTLKSLNEALDLNITEYITVNFDAVIKAVDALGGITINIDSEELKYINSYIDATSQSSGIYSKHITKTGKQKLDGVQAVAYSRIRYTSGGDYKRTERMRTVITSMIEQAKTLDLGQLNNFADTILDGKTIKTNISKGDIWGLVPKLASITVGESLGWPYKIEGITLDKWYGVPVTLESNVEKLHKEAFGQEDYEVSETVKEMSQAIINKTGYTD